MALLALEDVSKHFVAGPFWARTTTQAVDSVSLAVERGETLGVLGESGSGKTTLMRLAAFLMRPDTGSVRIDGENPWTLSSGGRRQLRRRLQIVFQEGGDGLDPRQSVAAMVDEPLANFGVPQRERRSRVADAVESVGLPPELIGRYAAEMSGGQRQRVGIARALVLDPEIVLLDEPVSALDVSIAAQVLNLLADLKAARNLSYVLVSHELPVVRYLAQRVLVMYAGRVVEEGAARDVLERPAHPYTQSLRAAALTVDPGAGLPLVPPPAPPTNRGCAFATRCPAVMPRCLDAPPPSYEVDGRRVRCFLFDNDRELKEEPWRESASLTTS